MASFIECTPETDFPLQNIPFGVFSTEDDVRQSPLPSSPTRAVPSESVRPQERVAVELFQALDPSPASVVACVCSVCVAQSLGQPMASLFT